MLDSAICAFSRYENAVHSARALGWGKCEGTQFAQLSSAQLSSAPSLRSRPRVAMHLGISTPAVQPDDTVAEGAVWRAASQSHDTQCVADGGRTALAGSPYSGARRYRARSRRGESCPRQTG